MDFAVAVELTQGCGDEPLMSLLLGSVSDKSRLFNGDPFSALSFSAYSAYYNSLCSLTAFASHSGFHDINELVSWLAENRTREVIFALLQAKYPQSSVDSHDAAIDLGARLLLMLHFGTVRCEMMPRRSLTWNSGPLKDFLTAQFEPQTNLCCVRVRLPKSFNAWSLEAVSGVTIDFTDNLADHLLLVDDSRVLIFHHASFLESHRASDFDLYPDGLLEETLNTLALLFPQAVVKSKQSWFQRLCVRNATSCIDRRVALCGNLPIEHRQIERFKFWRDRLVMLKETFDEAKPVGIRQWWHDRRNGPQWCTFWVAVLVLVITTTLGVVQCVEGAFQAFRS